MKNRLMIICLTLLLAFVASPVYAIQYEDVVDNPELERKLDILDGLGILNGDDDSMFNEYGNITRGDFAAMVAGLTGYALSTVDYSSKSSFSDIQVGTPLCGKIEYLNKLGIVYGVGKGSFNVDADITLYEASVMLSRALGYEAIGEYLDVNNPIQVLYGLGVITDGNLKSEGPITWASAVQMVYNSLDTEMVTADFSTMFPKYSVKNDVTPLNYYLKCGKGEGVITANSRTRLDEPIDSAENSVTINNVIYNAGDTDIEQYLGYRVEFYYNDITQDKDYTIKAFAPYKTKTLEIQDEEIASYEGSRIHYYPGNNEKESTARISSTSDFIYNGTAYPDYTKDDILVDDGSLTLIDNDSDGNYDVICVNAYESYVVNNVNSSLNTIYLEGITEAVDLTPDRYDQLGFFDENREAASFGDISEGAVVTLVRDKSGKSLDVYISNKTISGKITYISDTRFEIDLIPYKYNKTFEKELETLGTSYDGEFLLDVNGKVTAVKDKVSTDLRYGYYTALYETEEGMGDVKMKVFTSNGTFVIYPLAKSVTVDGARIEKEDLLEDSRFFVEGANTKYNLQLIKYKLNESGEIRTIITESSVNESEANLPEKFTKLDVSGVRYKAGPKYFAKKAYMTNDTLLFKVPTLDSTSFSDDAYSLNKVQLADSMTYNNMVAYDVDEGGEAPVLVYKVPYIYSKVIGGTETPGDDNACVIVKDLYMGVNQAGEPVPVITVVEGGNEITLAGLTDETLQKPVIGDDGAAIPDTYKYLAKGDIIKYSKNENNEITGIQVCFDSERTDPGIYVKNSGEICGFDYGQVYSKGNSGIRMSSTLLPGTDDQFDFGEDALTAFPVNNVSIIVYDVQSDEIRSGTINDIKDYISCGGDASMAFARTKYYEIRELFIIQK